MVSEFHIKLGSFSHQKFLDSRELINSYVVSIETIIISLA